MIVKPLIRSNICLNAHPAGCKASVEQQIAYTKKQKAESSVRNMQHAGGKTPRNVLVLGCSNGYGLASRITAAFGYGAATVGVSLEKEGTESKGGTPGWYNIIAFDGAAAREGLTAVTINGDAFSDEIKRQVIETARKLGIRFDLVVYSLASPVRTDPETGVMYKSVLKPIGAPYSGKTVDMMTGKISVVTAEPATEDEIAQTVKVMGGEDWRRWIDQLLAAKALDSGCVTVAYSYIGPELSHAIYRSGTIGKAKEDLEKTAHTLYAQLKGSLGGAAYVSVNKGLVTRASAVIPIIPLYLSVLFRVMKKKGTHEGCIEQIDRLFAHRLYTADGVVPVDSEGRIRIDDWEMDETVQAEVNRILERINEENITELSDLEGYHHDFLAANGFDIAGVDYEKDTAVFNTV
ncbi:MAG: trans-2-enoyl-CoA reductase family protein [Spirochaetaceae bacterium]|jgi:enoyl-[acyl-carrier protein] reductase/trans-2-enoyl-CoA reductase (NAD+)|nr:trans-2-enoyl-CoA reductase family protein [Spirochaetaceae bacterium]